MIIRATLAFFLIVSCLLGCVADGPQPPPRRPIRDIPQPEGLQPETVLLNAGPFPVDGDGNGYADLFKVTVFIFPPSNQHPLPIHTPGTFEFTLDDENENRLATWEYSGEAVERAKARPLPGPSYVFELNMNDVGTDKVNARNGSLRCTFITPEGKRIAVRGPTIVRVGRTGAGG